LTSDEKSNKSIPYKTDYPVQPWEREGVLMNT